MLVVAVGLCLLMGLGVWQARTRLAAMDIIASASAEDIAPGYVTVCARDVHLSQATINALVEHAQSRDLDVLDVVPGALPWANLMAVVELVDPAAFRDQPLGRSSSAGYAVCVSEGVASRAAPELAAAQGAPPAEFIRAAGQLRHFAPRRAAMVIAPLMDAPKRDASTRRRMLAALIPGGMERAVIYLRALFILVLLALVVIQPWPGVLPLIAYHLQPLLACAGRRKGGADERGATPAQGSRRSLADEARTVLFRTLAELRDAAALLAALPFDPEALARRRAAYSELLRGDPQRLVEPRRDTCPLCGSAHLGCRLRAHDYLQHKPGAFRLDSCAGCGHIFQNPRLSLEGLDLYYRDVYDGLGEPLMESAFSSTPRLYLARAELVARHGTPERWLDVGTGHAHFALVAREVLPSTRFDGLDLGDGVERAARRGWLDEAHIGLLPERAVDLAGRYDVVSMHHYLEHTVEPAAEIEAASLMLGPGGLLEIEVPNPECRWGRILGSWWIPWFQPQHLHLLNTTNLSRLLKENGFEPLEWHTGKANTPSNWLLSSVYQLRWLAGGPLDAPWRPPTTRMARLRHAAVWSVGSLWMAACVVLDAIFEPLGRRSARWSNAFRVVARRVNDPVE